MTRILTIALFASCSISVSAQTEGVTINDTIATDMGVTHDYVTPYNEDIVRHRHVLPTLTEYGTMPTMRWYPGMWGGWHAWDVHDGLNLSVGASVFSTFGSGHTYKGAGFSNNISMVYVEPLTEKLSLAIGGYFSNLTWAHSSYRDAGLTAVLGYQFDEHWSGYIYGQKSLANNRALPYPLMNMAELGDRVGAAVRYNFNPSFSVQVSVDYAKPVSPFQYVPPFSPNY